MAAFQMNAHLNTKWVISHASLRNDKVERETFSNTKE